MRKWIKLLTNECDDGGGGIVREKHWNSFSSLILHVFHFVMEEFSRVITSRCPFHIWTHSISFSSRPIACEWRKTHNMHDWRQFALISVSFLSLFLFSSSVFYSRFRFLHALPIDVIKLCMYKIFMALFPSSAVLFQLILQYTSDVYIVH